ncbi:MAG: hypothetical protein WC273_08230 [Dehalococcoidia bacterium]
MMPAEAGRSGTDEVPGHLRGTWVADELAGALRHIDALTHAMESLQQGMRLQQQEIARLGDGLQTVDGRSQRHEAGQEVALGLRQEIAALRFTLDAEAELRRDLVARIERGDAREAETQRELQRVLTQIASRLDTADGRQASIAEREQHLAGGLADAAREEQSTESRLTNLERRLAAERDATRHTGQEIARVAGAIPELLAKIEDLAVRMRGAQEEQRRVVEDVALISAVRDRETDLLDALEQQRLTRARLEDRLNTIEEEIEAVRRDSAAVQEQLALLARDRAHEAEERRRLQERLEAQRDTVAEHLRRALHADEDRARRRIEEIERDVRVARSLLVRLDEQASETEQEQPL